MCLMFVYVEVLDMFDIFVNDLEMYLIMWLVSGDM